MVEGLILQFGVMDGWSLEQIARRFPEKTVYGFDSFMGIEEDWGNLFKRGAMKTNIPDMPNNVVLVKGLIEDTLPDFLREHGDSISFVHIDTDTYTPAKFILDHIKKRLIVGSVILFDEYWNYPGYEEHEYRAFREFTKQHPHIVFSQYGGPVYFSRAIKTMGWERMIIRLICHPVRVLRSLCGRIIKAISFNRNDSSMAFVVKEISGEVYV